MKKTRAEKRARRVVAWLLPSLLLMFTSGAHGELVHHWEFEGNANDSTGTWHGAGGSGFAPGMIGQAATFNGTAASNITFAFDTTGLKNITVAFWLKLAPDWVPTRSGLGRIMGGADNFEAVFGTSSCGNGRIGNNFYMGGGNYPVSTTVPTPDLWCHVALTSSLSTAGGNGRAEVWINGVLEAFSDTEAGEDWADGNFAFGQRPGAGGYRLPGLMDDVQIYNEILTEGAIKNVMEGVPTRAHDPSPANRASRVPLNPVLSWKTAVDPADPNVRNPAITGHNLWLSIAYDPANPPASPDWEDPRVQIIQLPADVNLADGKVDPNASYSPGTLQRDALYFWIVDESLGAANPQDWDKLIAGAVWSFETVSSGPQVSAGDDILIWLKEGIVTVDLTGTVTDATGDVTFILWSVVSSPPDSIVRIADASKAATKVTLTAAGRYVFELHAVDAKQNEDPDQVEIAVYEDSCRAAQSLPGYVPIPGDLNNDCRVDELDMAILQEHWLECNALDCNGA